jgi:hypothetical protein
MALHEFMSNQPQSAVHRVSFGTVERDRLCDTAVRTAAAAYLKHMGCVKDAMRAGREIQVGFGGPVCHSQSRPVSYVPLFISLCESNDMICIHVMFDISCYVRHISCYVQHT